MRSHTSTEEGIALALIRDTTTEILKLDPGILPPCMHEPPAPRGSQKSQGSSILLQDKLLPFSTPIVQEMTTKGFSFHSR